MVENDTYWDTNMNIVNALITDPNVDASKVFVGWPPKMGKWHPSHAA